MEYTEIIRERRSVYDLTDDVDISNEELKYFFEDILTYSPSSMNSQSTKIVLLLDEAGRNFWNKVKENARGNVNEEKFKGFINAKGTALIFYDGDIVSKLEEKFPSLKENFIRWAYENCAVVYTNIWNGLVSLNLGANLEHFNPFIESWVNDFYKLPKNFKLVAQMPFGGIISKPEEKKKLSIDEMFRMFEK